MKWSRRENDYWEDEDYTIDGDNIESLINDIIDRENIRQGKLESLNNRIDIFQKILIKMLEKMDFKDIKEIIKELTYYDDYIIEEDA